MNNCNWIEMTETWVAEDGTYFPIGNQYVYDAIVLKSENNNNCDISCDAVINHYKVCLKDVWYEIPSSVAVISPSYNLRSNDENGGLKWRKKYRADDSDWMDLSVKTMGSFPKRKGKSVNVKKYNKIIGNEILSR